MSFVDCGFEMSMSTHQFKITWLGVLLSVRSNVSLFTQWITVSFTKAFSFTTGTPKKPGLARKKAEEHFIDATVCREKFLERYFYRGNNLIFRAFFSLTEKVREQDSKCLSPSSKLFTVYFTNGKRTGFLSKQPKSTARYGKGWEYLAICDAWAKESRTRTPKSKFTPVYDIVNVLIKNGKIQRMNVWRKFFFQLFNEVLVLHVIN